MAVWTARFAKRDKPEERLLKLWEQSKPLRRANGLAQFVERQLVDFYSGEEVDAAADRRRRRAS